MSNAVKTVKARKVHTISGVNTTRAAKNCHATQASKQVSNDEDDECNSEGDRCYNSWNTTSGREKTAKTIDGGVNRRGKASIDPFESARNANACHATRASKSAMTSSEWSVKNATSRKGKGRAMSNLTLPRLH